MNKIQSMYDKMEKQVKQRIVDGVTTQEKVDKCSDDLDMEMMEYIKLQELKSLAVVSGILTPDEGQTIYASLGETLETFNDQPVWVKAVLTNVFKELLELHIVNVRKEKGVGV